MSQTLPSIALEAALPSKGEDTTANTIDWHGLDDTANPINWPTRKRWAHIVTVAILGLIPQVFVIEDKVSYSLNISLQEHGYDYGCTRY